MNIQSLEVDEDHVHLFIEILPQRSVGEAVRILKSVSARMMFTDLCAIEPTPGSANPKLTARGCPSPEPVDEIA